jgi:hypothetical protein
MDKLVELLSSKKFTRWTPLHDYALALGKSSEVHWKCIESAFSANEIAERIKFLGEEELQRLRAGKKN